MKASDVDLKTFPSEIPIDEKRMCRAAHRCSEQVDWRRTRIVTPKSAAYARDADVDATRREKLHKALDAMCAEGNHTTDEAERMHALLDRLLDAEPEESESESDEPEEIDHDEEPEGMAMDRRQVAYDSAPVRSSHRQVGRWEGNLSRALYEQQERMRRYRVH